MVVGEVTYTTWTPDGGDRKGRDTHYSRWTEVGRGEHCVDEVTVGNNAEPPRSSERESGTHRASWNRSNAVGHWECVDGQREHAADVIRAVQEPWRSKALRRSVAHGEWGEAEGGNRA